MKEEHPVLQRRGFAARTAPLVEFNTVLTDSIVRNESALVCYGASRNGKTTCVEALHRSLVTSRAIVPFWAHVANFEQAGAAPKFWRSFQTGLVPETHVIPVSSPYDALVGRVATECDKADTRRVVFALDEAQALDTERLDMLKALTEDLIRRGLSPFALLVAQPAILTRADELRGKGRHDLVARFYTNVFRFRGLTLKDLPMLLTHYDASCWPADSGVTYTAYFLPELWGRGWRMAQQVEPLWDAFVQQARALRVQEKDLELGTEYVVRAALLLMLALAKDPELARSREPVVQAVARSGFAESFTVVGNAEKDALTKLEQRRRQKQTA